MNDFHPLNSPLEASFVADAIREMCNATQEIVEGIDQPNRQAWAALELARHSADMLSAYLMELDVSMRTKRGSNEN